MHCIGWTFLLSSIREMNCFACGGPVLLKSRTRQGLSSGLSWQIQSGAWNGIIHVLKRFLGLDFWGMIEDSILSLSLMYL